MFISHKISIVLLTFNRDKYLKYSIEAILNQSYKEFEFLIIDNGSTDSTPSVVLNYNDRRIKYVRLPVGGNSAVSFFNAIKLSQGKYILITHDDDIMEKDLLKKQLEIFDNDKDVKLVCSNVSLINENNKKIQDKLYDINSDLYYEKNFYLKEYIEKKLWLPTPTICFDKKILVKIYWEYLNDFQKESIENTSDDIWQSIMFNTYGKVVLLHQPLLKYRQHSAQESRNLDQSLPMLNLSIKLLKTKRILNSHNEYKNDIWSLYFKYKLQHILFNTGNDKILNKIKALKKLYNSVIFSNYFMNSDMSTPFEIILFQLNLYGLDDLKQNLQTKIMSSSYSNWLFLLSQNKTIFFNIKVKNILIFGSMLTSYLIVNDAIKSNINVKCCIDSSLQRIGKNVWGIEIVNLNNINEYIDGCDMIILSNEREHNEAIKTLIHEKLNNNFATIKIATWKELVDIASNI